MVFSTTLVGSSELKISTLIFLHDGIISPTANESWAVAGGTVKFSIEVSSWPFCDGESGNPCRGDTGRFLEFGMEIKGMGDATLDGGKRYTLATNAAAGNNISLELSDEVQVDGTWLAMPAGYPKIEMQGGKQLFLFRLPRFVGSALYDPLIDGLSLPAPPSSPAPLQPAHTSAPPPPSPSLPLPPQLFSVELEAVLAGDPSSFDREGYKAALATILDGVVASDITLKVLSASVRVIATIAVANDIIGQSLADQLNELNATALSSALGNGFVVISTSAALVSAAASSKSTSSAQEVPIVVIAVGVASVAILLGGAAICFRYSSKSTKSNAQGGVIKEGDKLMKEGVTS